MRGKMGVILLPEPAARMAYVEVARPNAEVAATDWSSLPSCGGVGASDHVAIQQHSAEGENHSMILLKGEEKPTRALETTPQLPNAGGACAKNVGEIAMLPRTWCSTQRSWRSHVRGFSEPELVYPIGTPVESNNL